MHAHDTPNHRALPRAKTQKTTPSYYVSTKLVSVSNTRVWLLFAIGMGGRCSSAPLQKYEGLAVPHSNKPTTAIRWLKMRLRRSSLINTSVYQKRKSFFLYPPSIFMYQATMFHSHQPNPCWGTILVLRTLHRRGNFCKASQGSLQAQLDLGGLSSSLEALHEVRYSFR